MITVKLFGLLRLDTGVKQLQLEAGNMKQVQMSLLAASERITQKDLGGCVILINGKPGKWKSKLNDDDEVVLLSPVAGG